MAAKKRGLGRGLDALLGEEIRRHRRARTGRRRRDQLVP